MKRTAAKHLLAWKDSTYRKPLLVRGARQVGKTHLVRQLGREFESFVEVNFEQQAELMAIFKRDLDPVRIVRELQIELKQSIDPGKTLLFLDEIQSAPIVLTALRYFYEQMPQLHVIAAGSLIEFAIESVGIPVGRVESIYLFPLSFMEFLEAKGESLLAGEINSHLIDRPFSEPIHQKSMRLLGEYFFVGGLPEAVQRWINTGDVRETARVHQTLVDTYRQDFFKYATKTQMKYLRTLFDRLPWLVGKKFKYASISDSLRKRELAPCLELMMTAGLVHAVTHTAAQGVPLGAQTNPDDFKIVFVDIAIAQTVLGGGGERWLLDVPEQVANKGEAVEAFVGQELLAYADPHRHEQLYYWRREEANSKAEVDYVSVINSRVVPIEVKSGHSGRLKSMHQFLESHRDAPYGLRFFSGQYQAGEKIVSYPLYAIAPALLSVHPAF